jgi:hypothetical protein
MEISSEDYFMIKLYGLTFDSILFEIISDLKQNKIKDKKLINVIFEDLILLMGCTIDGTINS